MEGPIWRLLIVLNAIMKFLTLQRCVPIVVLEEIEEIICFYTQKFGEAEEGYDGRLIWKDAVGQEYSLYLDDNSSNALPDYIQVQFEP